MTLDRRDPAYHTSLVRCSFVGGGGGGADRGNVDSQNCKCLKYVFKVYL